MKVIIVIAALFALGTPAFGANHFVWCGATGTNAGTTADWNNAFQQTPTTWVRGDTYYFAGSGGCTYNGFGISTNPSGSSLITIKKVDAANCGSLCTGATNYQSSFSTAQAVITDGNQINISTSFVTIDGITGKVTPGNPETVSQQFGFKVSNLNTGSTGTVFVVVSPCNNDSFSHIEAAGNGTANGQWDIQVQACSTPEVIFDHIYVHDVNTGFQVQGADLTISNSYITRTLSAPANHGEAVSLANGISSCHIFNNYWVDVLGTGVIVAQNSSGAVSTCSIYNNVFWEANPGASSFRVSNGVMACINGNVCTGWQVYNNTTSGFQFEGGGVFFQNNTTTNASSVTGYNNLWYNNAGLCGFGSLPNTTEDYEYFALDCGTTLPGTHTVRAAPPLSNPGVGDFNLTSHVTDGNDTLGAPFNIDLNHTPRPIGSWDRGSFEAVLSTDCGKSVNWTSSRCQILGSGSLGPQWTVISRHGEYSQAETECNIPQNVSVGSSNLTITTQASAYTCGDFDPTAGTACSAKSTNPCPTSYPYSTGDVQWTNLSFQYGTVIVSAKMPPSNTNLWPAFWLLGANCQTANKYTGDTGLSGCPNLGSAGYIEIDMVECYNGGGWCQFHVANPNFNIGGGCDAVFTVDTNFHTYALNWTPSTITLTKDGSLVTTCNQALNGPMFFINQIQTGGPGGTPTNANLPASSSIDFVKVCNSNYTVSQCTNAATNDANVIFYDDFSATTLQVATPVFSPIAGTYVGTQVVSVSTTTGGATLCYTIDGSNPTANGAGACTHGTTYSVPLSILNSETVKAVGSESGFTDSSIASASYVITHPVTISGTVVVSGSALTQ